MNFGRWSMSRIHEFCGNSRGEPVGGMIMGLEIQCPSRVPWQVWTLCKLCASTHGCTSNLHVVICFTQTHCDDYKPTPDQFNHQD
jgi:hypothetical protein